MGYQEAWLYMESNRKFKKLIRAYEKADQAGYYDIAQAAPLSVLVLKQPMADILAGTKILWAAGERSFLTAGGLFGGHLEECRGLRICAAESVLSPDDPRLDGIDLDSTVPTENAYMRRYSVENYAHRLRAGLER